MHFVKAGAPNKYIGTCARMSVSLCLKKARQSHHQCASKRSGSVGNRGELAPLNQARGAQSTKSCLGGTELCKAQNCSKHKIVQSTKLCKTQNCAKHKIVQRTKFCKAQICAKHKLVQSTKLFKACVQYLNTCCLQIGALSIV